LSERGGIVRSTAGFRVETEKFGSKSFDTIVVTAGLDRAPASPGVLKFLKRSAERSRRLASICVGAFALAEAGVLDGRRATTHWHYARDLQARFPNSKVEEDRIFIVDDKIWTSAGMTAGLDLALAMVEKDYGAEVSRSVARMLVVYHRRAGGQSQFSALLELEPKSDRIQRALNHAKSHLSGELSVEELAEVARLSPRQFSRAFRLETGQSPARAVEKLRVEVAELMVGQGRLSLDEIATETGFGDRGRMRRAFVRTLGQPPISIRRRQRVNAEP
jgi:transcriptional regulator GlxA family with amidase domain